MQKNKLRNSTKAVVVSGNISSSCFPKIKTTGMKIECLGILYF